MFHLLRCAKCLMAQVWKSAGSFFVQHQHHLWCLLPVRFLLHTIRECAGKGCDVLAKNDRGHTPFDLCTDPEASQWCLCLLSISHSCCILVELPCKSRLYSCIVRRSETTCVLIFSGTTALAECHECNSLQGHTRSDECWVCRCLISWQALHCLNSGGIWKAVLLHCVEISLLLAAVFRPIN